MPVVSDETDGSATPDEHLCQCGDPECVEPIRRATRLVDRELAAAINYRLGLGLKPADIAAIVRVLSEALDQRLLAAEAAGRPKAADRGGGGGG
jgi:hypothetical protein